MEYRHKYLSVIDRGGNTPLFFIVSKNQINKEELKVRVLKLKAQLQDDPTWYSNPKDVAHKYLNKVLDMLDEYRY